MLFKKEFRVIEVYESGVEVTNYLRGTRKAVNKDIEWYKANFKKFKMVSRNEMIVWG